MILKGFGAPGCKGGLGDLGVGGGDVMGWGLGGAGGKTIYIYIYIYIETRKRGYRRAPLGLRKETGFGTRSGSM